MAKPAFDPSKPFQIVSKPPFDPSKPFTVLDSEPPVEGPGLGEKIETGARSAFEGLTLGASEPVISGINAVVGNLIDAGFDADTIGEFAKKAASSSAIEQQYQKDVERRRKLESELPNIAIPAEIGGAIAPGFISGGAATVAAGLPKLGMTAGEIAAKAVPTALGKAITRGAVSAGASEALKAAVEVPTGFQTPADVDVTRAALTGGKFGAGFYGLGKAISAVPDFTKKVLSTLGGVNESAIAEYIKDPKAVFRAKSPEQIKDLIDTQVDQLVQGIEKQTIDVDDAQKGLNAAKQALRDAENARKLEFQTSKFNANQVLDRAQEKFDNAVKTAQDLAEKSLDRNKQIFRDEVLDSLDKLKNQVVKGSQDSYKLLERSKVKINFNEAKDIAAQALEDLKVDGKIPQLKEPADAYTAIENILRDLKRFKKPIPAAETKKYIQQIDKTTTYSPEFPGMINDTVNKTLKLIRGSLDKQVKDIPEYQALMQEVSDNASLLEQANKNFGTAQKAASKISRITDPRLDIERQILSNLGQKTNKPFGQKIDELTQVESLGKPQLQKMLGEEPIGQQLALAQQEAKRLGTPGLLQKEITKLQTESPEALALAQRQQKALETQQMLESTQQKLKDLGPFGRPISNISAIKTAVSGRNPEYDQFLSNLTKLSGKDFKKYIDDLRLAEQFNKEFRIGSRNVNLWALGAGGAWYGLTGDSTTALLLAGLGGGFGSLVDRFGPQMTQKVLDSYLKVQGIPTIKKINEAFSNLPTEIVQQVKNDFIRSYPTIKDEPIEIGVDQRGQISKDIQESNLSSLKKAKMIRQMNLNGTLNGSDISMLMIGKKAPQPVFMPSAEKKDLKLDKPDVLKALQERARGTR